MKRSSKQAKELIARCKRYAADPASWNHTAAHEALDDLLAELIWEASHD